MTRIVGSRNTLLDVSDEDAMEFLDIVQDIVEYGVPEAEALPSPYVFDALPALSECGVVFLLHVEAAEAELCFLYAGCSAP